MCTSVPGDISFQKLVTWCCMVDQALLSFNLQAKENSITISEHSRLLLSRNLRLISQHFKPLSQQPVPDGSGIKLLVSRKKSA